MAESAISAGAEEFIQKPFSAEELRIRFSRMVKTSQTIRQMKNDGGEEDIRDLLGDLEAALSDPPKAVLHDVK
jgi:FixJ family two-component response regulator